MNVRRFPLFFALLLLVSCVVDPPPPTLEYCPVPLADSVFSSADPTSAVNYLEKQLVITSIVEDAGDRTDDVIAAVNAEISDAINNQLFQIESMEATGAQSVISLYETGADVIKIATLFNKKASELAVTTRAEPNYIVSQPKGLASSTGDPGSSHVEGNPGSSHVEGNSGGDAVVAAGNFADQWALKHTQRSDDGYFLAGSSQLSDSSANLIVLDSSSWEDGRYMHLQLDVCNLLGAPGTDDKDKHGLFVASLASATATERNAFLVQVLKADGKDNIRGDLFTILGVLHALAENPMGDPASAHTVINLSLGFEFDPQAEDHAEFINTIRTIALGPNEQAQQNDERKSELWQAVGDEFREQVVETEGESPLYEVNFPIVALRALFYQIDEAGYVIVAAAGNDAQEMPQSPASFKTVVGVQATNFNGLDEELSPQKQRSCFSNRGNISAPGGGDGSGAPGDDNPMTDELLEPCIIDFRAECENSEVCRSAPTGHLDGDETATNVQLGYWAGTSFAAPLVSGVGVSVINFANEQGVALTPEQVRRMIYCTATGNAPASGNVLAHTPSVGIVNASRDRLKLCLSQIAP